ncbi:MAG: S8 family serine peptidase [Cyanobacteria bacterium P01_F01_bin.150]
MVSRPNDFYFDEQWYLDNQGQGGRTVGIDLNVLGVWDDYTGQGVTVAVLDDGIERDHEDLQANYNSAPIGLPSYRYQRDGAPAIRDDNHGTSVAGIIAAERNDIGIIGVAYNATITSFLNFGITEDAATPLEQQRFFDISNNSWGVDNPFESNFELEINAKARDALAKATRRGRNGLGTVFIWAAGNEFEAGASSNYGGYESSRFTISVAAIDGDGIVAPYSVQGSNLLVSAFGDGDPTQGIPGSIVTTDRTGNRGYNPSPDAPNELDNRNYTGEFNGTSSATPMVSGVVALMLEANPELGYRDVQEILAYSAFQTEPRDVDEDDLPNWAFNGAKNWNGGGLHVNINYGYGLVDAHAAVRLAETWTTQHTFANEQRLDASSSTPVALNDRGITTSSVTIAADAQTSDLTIDQVDIDIDLSHQSIEELIITLVSPSGTRSRLFMGPDLADVFLDDGGTASFSSFADDPREFTDDRALIALGESYRQGIDFTFSTTFHWGEQALGDWTLEVEDISSGVTGTLNNWTLSLYGDSVSNNDTYFYGNDFRQMVRRDASTSRTILSDEDGRDRINAAMVTSNLNLNLNPGRISTIAGQELTIAPDTVIEDAIGGDGRDAIRGNSVSNRIVGGRNSDRLLGLSGDDWLLGEQGNDRLKGGADHDRLRGHQGNDRLIGGPGNDRLKGGGGDDRLKGGGGNNVLRGGGGDDWLYGQQGNSRMTGNRGNDIFVLQPGDGESIIQDFQLGRDRIGLSHGLTFADITLSQENSDVLIRANGDHLATIVGENVNRFSQSNFIKV